VQDIADSLHEQDPQWIEKLRGPDIHSSDNPEISIPGVFPMQSRILGMANGGRCIPSIYPQLREIRLQLPVPSFDRVQATWRALRVEPFTFENEPVQVILMDWQVGRGTATVIANPDGNAEMFFSDGGRFSGGSQRHPSIREAGVRATAAAGKCLTFFGPTSSIDLPEDGGVTFYLKSKGELLMATTTEESLLTGSDPLSLLHAAMLGIVAEYRLKFPK
jgi:hypothetical protein